MRQAQLSASAAWKQCISHRTTCILHAGIDAAHCWQHTSANGVTWCTLRTWQKQSGHQPRHFKLKAEPHDTAEGVLCVTRRGIATRRTAAAGCYASAGSRSAPAATAASAMSSGSRPGVPPTRRSWAPRVCAATAVPSLYVQCLPLLAVAVHRQPCAVLLQG